MKYEKFEEWMVGKKFYNVYDPNDIGVIVGKGEEGGVVDVIYENDGPSWARICNVNFVDSPEEKPSEKSKQIDWQVGQVVWDVRNGRGIVKEISDDEYYPIYVVFDLTDRYGDAVSDIYTLDGRYVDTQKVRSLFFSEPVITAELFPPKKPFIPTLKKGDTIVAHNEMDRGAIVFKVYQEQEEYVQSVDGECLYKNIWEFSKLGEEIKFQ